MLEMTSDNQTNAEKHVTSNNACVRSHRYTLRISLLISPNDVVRYEVT